MALIHSDLFFKYIDMYMYIKYVEQTEGGQGRMSVACKDKSIGCDEKWCKS